MAAEFIKSRDLALQNYHFNEEIKSSRGQWQRGAAGASCLALVYILAIGIIIATNSSPLKELNFLCIKQGPFVISPLCLLVITALAFVLVTIYKKRNILKYPNIPHFSFDQFIEIASFVNANRQAWANNNDGLIKVPKQPKLSSELFVYKSKDKLNVFVDINENQYIDWLTGQLFIKTSCSDEQLEKALTIEASLRAKQCRQLTAPVFGFLRGKAIVFDPLYEGPRYHMPFSKIIEISSFVDENVQKWEQLSHSERTPFKISPQSNHIYIVKEKGQLRVMVMLDVLGAGALNKVFMCVDWLSGKFFAQSFCGGRFELAKAGFEIEEHLQTQRARHVKPPSFGIFEKEKEVIVFFDELYEGNLTKLTIGDLNQKQRLSIMRQLLEGLADIANAGVIHADFDLSNIYFKMNGDGEIAIVIADFNVSWIPSQGNAILSQIKGKPSTATPSIHLANLIKKDKLEMEGVSEALIAEGAKTHDSWGLGLVLHSLLTGTHINAVKMFEEVPEKWLEPNSRYFKFLNGEWMQMNTTVGLLLAESFPESLIEKPKDENSLLNIVHGLLRMNYVTRMSPQEALAMFSRMTTQT